MKSGFMLIGLCVALAGCDAQRPKSASQVAPTNWRVVATANDAARLHDWREAFISALNSARAKGHAAEIAKEGALLEPDAAIAGATLRPGDYQCRTIKVGTPSGTGPGYVAYPPFRCRIADEGEVASFAKLSGSQRPVGLIFTGDTRRQIFLGTLMLGDESRAIEYGRDPDRDMAGAIENVGPNRWRLILPYPRFESILDVIELVPAA